MSDTTPFQILGVDPSTFFLDGLEKCLRDLGEIRFARARDQAEALLVSQGIYPHLILLGHGLNEVEAFESCRLFRANDRAIGIVLFSAQVNDDLFQVDALAAGANVCLDLETAYERFIDAIRMVIQKRVLFAPAILQMLQIQEELTTRELVVLRELVLGKTDREIAETLSIGLCTVKTHTAHIRAKLHSETRHQAITRAKRNGWV